MMICDRWEVVVVPFPFVDSPTAKPRPALILSSRIFNGEHEHSILAMITRAKRVAWPSDHLIADLETAGLRETSVVRWKLFTLDNRVLWRQIGQLGPLDIGVCRRTLEAVFLDTHI